MKNLPRATMAWINAAHPPAKPATNPFAGMNEKEFTAAVIEYAQQRQWRVAHFRPARVMRGGKETYETPVAGDGKGFLDLELVRERLVKIELKVRPNVRTDEQLAWMEAYWRAGVEVHLFYPEDWQQLVEVLE